jgi:hypothetical protein
MDIKLYGYDFGLKQAEDYQELKFLLHRFLIGEIERDRIALFEIPRTEVADYVRGKVNQYIAEKHLPVSGYDLENLSEDMVDELAGYGPLETLSMAPRRFSSSGKGGWKQRRCASSTTSTYCVSFAAFLPISAGVSTSRARWWTPACRTEAGSMPLFRRWRSTVRASPSASSARTHCWRRT